MGNATDKIKAAADFTTTDVDKDGIYHAFLRLGLID
jgi:hydroxymethylpyrimidine pyrophosphatase-like HAD family hydrolase